TLGKLKHSIFIRPEFILKTIIEKYRINAEITKESKPLTIFNVSGRTNRITPRMIGKNIRYCKLIIISYL
ncbi:MAG: hypothetical protein KAS53_07515, partial [Candidatus Cloacimonetes bacterium]|nr:hypothetical protein [Candidatus Cloacimonadota bacterium]